MQSAGYEWLLWTASPYVFAAAVAYLVRHRWLPSLLFLVVTLAFASYGACLLIWVMVIAPDAQGGIAMAFVPIVQWGIVLAGSALTTVFWLSKLGVKSDDGGHRLDDGKVTANA